MVNANNKAEFKGQIIDALEDFCAEMKISIPNDEKDNDDYDDPEEMAIIYGSDYDVIGDEIEYLIDHHDETEIISDYDVMLIIGKLKDIVPEDEQGCFTRESETGLMCKIKDIFAKWGFETADTREKRITVLLHNAISCLLDNTLADESLEDWVEETAKELDCTTEELYKYGNIEKPVERYAYDIEWDVDYDEVYEMLDNMTYEEAAESLEMPKERYANMSTDERHDYAYDYFRHRPGAIDDFIGLPQKVRIPSNVFDDNAADWLSDEYGYCLYGFRLSTDGGKDDAE